MLAYSFAPMGRRLLLVALALLVVLVLLAGRAAAALARPDPGDITMRWPVPAPLESLIRQDWFAYRAHCVLAAALRLTNASPDAEAVQWLKAAAHARGPEQAAAVRAGVAAARGRAPDPSSFDADLQGIVASASDEMRRKVAARVPGFPYVG